MAREETSSDSPDVPAVAARAAVERANRRLSRWLGANGAYTLFSRALAQAKAEHAVLKDIRLRSRPDPGLEGVTESIQAHGASAVGAGLQALLVALLQLLGRLIGGDLAAQLMEWGEPQERGDQEREP